MNRLTGVAAVMLALLPAGCGVEVTSGGATTGEVRTVMTSDDPATSHSTSGAPARSLAPSPSAEKDAGSSSATGVAARPTDLEGGTSPTRDAPALLLRGSLDVLAAVTLVSESGQEVEATDGYQSGVFRIEGADSALIDVERVRVGTYTRARVTFRRVAADVEGGLPINGIPFLGRVTVAIGTEPVVIEAPIRLTVEENAEHTLVVDLNAAAWLAGVNPLTGEVTPSAFRSAVDVRVE